jgi:chaperonin cofactor prefoldin
LFLKFFVFLILIASFVICRTYGQSLLQNDGAGYCTKWNITIPYFNNDRNADSLFYFVKNGCKVPDLVMIPLSPVRYDTVTGIRIRTRKTVPAASIVVNERKPLITMHGNVMYDLYYQSNIDTPFVEKDVYQHTLQTSLELTYKDAYPIRVNFTTRMGNSSLFRNLTDFNMQFTNRDFKNLLLLKAKDWDAGRYKQYEEMDKLRAQIVAKQAEINRLKSWKADPSQLQQLIEAREKTYYAGIKDSLSKLNNISADDDIDMRKGKRGLEDKMKWPVDLKVPGEVAAGKSKTDTTVQRLTDQYSKTEKRIDSLQNELAKLQHIYQQKEKSYTVKRGQLTDVLTRSKNNKELADNLSEMGLPDSILPRGYKQLLAIRSVGIGRTVVNYSELTAKDISILGVQAEYNPSYYLAFATGKVDYRFRNFIFNENKSSQYLNLVRFGTGMKDGNNIILTYYTGRKQLYNFNTSDPGNGASVTQPDQRVMGVSIEGRWQLGANNSITGEAAKSSLPDYARADHGESSLGSVFQLRDRSNEAYSIKTNSFIPKTGTKITGTYRMMGANFQSFSLYTTGSSQTAWAVRVDQPFFRQRLTVSAAVRRNDFTTQYQQSSYQSNTVFKSIQATLRMKKWPVITAGYFPSSQLTKLSNGTYSENMFYTLVGTVSHFYRYKGIMMSTLLSYTQFYNKQTDSSFLYFNSKNTLLSHTVFLGKFTLNGAVSAALNPEYDLYGADGNVQYKITSWLEIGGGLKYSKQTVYELIQLGYSANMRISIPKLGEVALMADKGFIPGAEKRLVSNNTGRLTYTKTF